ncbi:hypothetical protein HRbin27_01795 [bacterium HR27]|nr:hypothetical protein HRbin27_01795 [bacterium HR27]
MAHEIPVSQSRERRVPEQAIARGIERPRQVRQIELAQPGIERATGDATFDETEEVLLIRQNLPAVRLVRDLLEEERRRFSLRLRSLGKLLQRCEDTSVQRRQLVVSKLECPGDHRRHRATLRIHIARGRVRGRNATTALPRGRAPSRRAAPTAARHVAPARTHPRGTEPLAQDRSVFGLADRPTRCAFPAAPPPVALPASHASAGAAFVPAHRCGAAPDSHRTSRHLSCGLTTRYSAPVQPTPLHLVVTPTVYAPASTLTRCSRLTQPHSRIRLQSKLRRAPTSVPNGTWPVERNQLEAPCVECHLEAVISSVPSRLS